MNFTASNTSFSKFNRKEKESIKDRISLLEKHLSHYFQYVERCDIKDFLLVNLKKDNNDKNTIELMLIFLDKASSEVVIGRTKRAISYFYKDINIIENKNCISFDIDNSNISLVVV